MGLTNQGPQAKAEKSFKYSEFKTLLGKEGLTEAQISPLKLRLSLLESYMEQRFVK
jgi:hypothetical protein